MDNAKGNEMLKHQIKHVKAAIATESKYRAADAAVKKFQEAAQANYDTSAFANGYLGSMVAGMAAQYLTKMQFAEFLAAMEQSAVKQQAEVDAKKKYALT
jgi:hypothetical protein